MRQLLKNPNAAAWIAEDAGIMCGFAIVEWTRESLGVVAYVQTIEVLPEFRGCGGAGNFYDLSKARHWRQALD